MALVAEEAVPAPGPVPPFMQLCVWIASPRIIGHQVFMTGFISSDTVRLVKDSLFRLLENIKPALGDPNRGVILSPEGFTMEDDDTLQSLLDLELEYKEWSTYLFYIPNAPQHITREPKMDLNWLSICQCVRLREEAHMENTGNPVSRPKTIQFAQLSDLRIHGQYELFDSNNSYIRVSRDLSDYNYSYVSVSRISLAASVKTSASVIILAPNHHIFTDLIPLNDKPEYLVVRVAWDILTYLFLRILRSSYPDIPIVAVTDLDPHHLDLLTFLDTPLEKLPCCYGWDLSNECRDEINNTSVNINWLGLRPADCKGLLHFDGVARYPPGFREVIRMLRANPFFRIKKHWLAALDWFDVFGKSVTFHPLAPADTADCHLFLGDAFVAGKLSKKDWV